jgi:hypothetical protein
MHARLGVFLWVSALAAVLLSFMAACSPAGAIKADTERTAAAINADFAKARQANDALVTALDAVYAKAGQLDLDTAFLSAEAGGAFRVFGANQFFVKTKAEGACYYYSLGGKAPDPAMLREIRLAGYGEAALTAAWKATADINTVVFFGFDVPSDLALMVPYFDVASALPPGIRLTMFEWYKRGIAATGGSLWSQEPFVDLTTGWVMDVAGRVVRDGGGLGATVISVNLGKINDKHLAKTADNLVLLSAAGVVMGTTAAAADALGVAGLNADVLQKTKENRFATADYLLGADAQTPLAKALSAALATGAAEGSVAAAGKTRGWLSVPIPETRCRLVGFTD